MITRYEYAPNVYTLFKYNSFGQVIGITDINDIAETDRTVTYKIDEKVDKVTDKYGFWKFTYNNDQLVQADSYANGSATPQAYYKYVYDGQKVVEVLFFSNYYNNIIHPQAKTDMQYDNNGDIVRSDVYLWDLTSGTNYKAAHFLYQNDTHPNPVYRMRDIFMVLYNGAVSPHNFTKAESFYADDTVNENNTFEFQYNNNDYPALAGRRNLVAGPNIFVTLKFLYQ